MDDHCPGCLCPERERERDEALFDAAQADVLHCRALYIAAVAAQTAGTEGRLSGQRTVLVARTALHQALVIRHYARGDAPGDRGQATGDS